MSEMNWSAIRDTLLFNPSNGYDRIRPEDEEEMKVFCAQYLTFADQGKTEREAVELTLSAAKKAGFVEFNPDMKLRPGDRMYRVNRQKAINFAIIGNKPLDHGSRIVVAHIDSPRLDLKPNPMYEDTELAYFKTHYYGGIKKYQWTTVPLALHGVIALTDGSVVKINIGEDLSDPVFCVSDLLIHLSSEQLKKTLGEGITGENLNVLVGSKPIDVD